MNNFTNSETITFYDVPLVCGAAPSIGCGSRAKPLLVDLEQQTPIEAAKIIHAAQHPRYPGLTPAEVKLNFRELIAQKDEVSHDYRKKKYESLTGGQFTIEKGHVEFVAKFD
jgi:hypothetical protein